MSVSPEEFRAALSKFASGVTVVTTKDNVGKLHGITVSAFCSVSLEPPLILVCIEKTSASHFAIAECGAFVVNILSENQIEHSNQFSLSIPEKFNGIDHFEGVAGLPVIENAFVQLECKLVDSHDSGDHTIFIGHVENSNVNDTKKPLLYFDGLYRKISEK